MAWSPFTLAAIGCTVWAVLAVLIAWGFSRFQRWLRGDFD